MHIALRGTLLVFQENWDVQWSGYVCSRDGPVGNVMGEGGKRGFADSPASVTL